MHHFDIEYERERKLYKFQKYCHRPYDCIDVYMSICGNQMSIVCVISFVVHYHLSLLYPIDHI
jgi:hypothetical protein